MFISGVSVAVIAILWVRPPAEGLCQNDPAISGNQGTAILPCECFSETYSEARTKFRTLAAKAGAQLHTIAILGEDYTTDIAVLEGSRPGLVVHTSGVHGIEGYAGSAIQLAWLQQQQDLRQQDRPTVILVHAVNPYGMAHYRRVNEDNVDLNRNALLDFETALSRHPNLVHYQDFSTAFNPTRLGFFGSILPTLISHIVRFGVQKLKTAMVTGQYHDPHGIFFGGQSLQPSLSKLYGFMEKWLQERTQHHPYGTGTVTWIDVHTGLGRSGEDTMLLHDAATKEDGALVFDGSHIPGLHKEGSEVSHGYELTIGFCEPYFQRLFDKTAWLVTQEFGTKSVILVGRALILENMYYHHAPESMNKGKALLQSSFYVRTPEWRRAILTRGLRVLDQGIQRSSK